MYRDSLCEKREDIAERLLSSQSNVVMVLDRAREPRLPAKHALRRLGTKARLLLPPACAHARMKYLCSECQRLSKVKRWFAEAIRPTVGSQFRDDRLRKAGAKQFVR